MHASKAPYHNPAKGDLSRGHGRGPFLILLSLIPSAKYPRKEVWWLVKGTAAGAHQASGGRKLALAKASNFIAQLHASVKPLPPRLALARALPLLAA